jgi:mono/diheme cytochrome c family protein
MRRIAAVLAIGALALGSVDLAVAGGSHSGGHGHGEATQAVPESMDQMREMHKAHEHGHDFDAMEEMTPEMDPARGRQVFIQKGCVACHSVNGVGGDLGPALNAADMPSPMNSFEFAARMWRGAQAMTALQEDLLGEVISLDGQDLADLVAFAHDGEEQAKLTRDQIPERYHGLIGE